MIPYARNTFSIKPSSSPSWTPASLTGLLAWFDPTNSPTITLDGSSRVSNVDSVNTSSYKLTNTLVTARRPYIEVYNSKNTFRTVTTSTADVSEFFQMTSFGFNNNSTFTIACAFTSYMANNATIFQIGAGGAGTPSTRILIVNNSSFQICTRPIAGNILFTPTQTLNQTLLNIIVITYSGNSNVSGLTCYLNGGTASTQASSHALSFTDPYNYIGAGGATPTALCFGKRIGDFIVSNSVLNQTQIDKVTGYLSHKWGSESLLPAGHPYKTSPPTS